MAKVKTVDVKVKEYYDKVNGNSYFGGEIVTNYGTKGAKFYKIPFQYGYGEHYKDIACKILEDNKAINKRDNPMLSYHRHYANLGITDRHYKEENVKESEVMDYSR